MLLVRHASAGDREEWVGDDRERPLDGKGRAQAETLVELLAPYPVERILSSPAARCLETVAPLAAVRALDVEPREELSEEQQHDAGAALVRSLTGADVVVCGHGGLEQTLPSTPKWKKGATLVLGPELNVLETLRA